MNSDEALLASDIELRQAAQEGDKIAQLELQDRYCEPEPIYDPIEDPYY